jgi:tRNA uridine 5-carboxymethylaminomethyl modification enzyme
MLDLGLEARRFKTGTPPRVDGRSVDLDRLERQDGEEEGYRFSHWEVSGGLERRPCWIARAGEEVKEIVESNLDRSALYGGVLASQGPRYCPSIEDKIVKFPEASGHQVFLEPEGLKTSEMYVNGLSTSLPPDVQREFLRAVPGLENARMTQPGYAIEYDFFPPLQLGRSLALKCLHGLYLAGQVNGTTGYEEAAAQGVVAGVNAAHAALEREPWVPGRDEAYIGVLVDDLVTRGVDEPYRLFTSRAEFRLMLRQDNALLRMGPVAERLGLLSEEELARLDGHLEDLERTRKWIREERIDPAEANEWLVDRSSSPLTERQPLDRLVRRPEVTLRELVAEDGPVRDPGLGLDALAVVEMEVKYDGYIRREEERAAALAEREGLLLPPDAPYLDFRSLSLEARQKLSTVRPQTMGQAARIPGVSPSDLQNLLVEIRKRGRRMVPGDCEIT